MNLTTEGMTAETHHDAMKHTFGLTLAILFFCVTALPAEETKSYEPIRHKRFQEAARFRLPHSRQAFEINFRTRHLPRITQPKGSRMNRTFSSTAVIVTVALAAAAVSARRQEKQSQVRNNRQQPGAGR